MSKLLGFSYLRFRHLVVLVLILAVVSCLFLVTSLSFIGVYRSFNAYLGEEADVIAVYDKQSRTPFTGSIPAYLADAVVVLRACWLVVLKPCRHVLSMSNQSL